MALISARFEEKALCDMSAAMAVSNWDCYNGHPRNPIDVCGGGWSYVTCDTNNAVVGISMYRGKSSPGKLPSGAEGLSFGSIPTSIGGLSLLTQLVLSYKSLAGVLPSEIGVLAGLQNLWLSGNYFTGVIPPAIGSLQALQSLNLGSNSFTSMPAAIGSLSSLTVLRVVYNSLHGTIPSVLGQMTALQHLSLHHNSLSGTIPAELGLLLSMTHLALEKSFYPIHRFTMVAMVASWIQMASFGQLILY